MPRTVTEAKLASRAARARLDIASRLIHWNTLEPGQLHLGYRRKARDQNGTWLARRYKGAERYQIAPLGLADDLADAGPGILSYADAVRAAHAQQWGTVVRRSGGMTIADAISDYVAWLKDHRATAHDAEVRARAWILPRLGSRRVAELTSKEITDWLKWMAERPALVRGGNHKERPTDSEARRVRRASANRTFTILKAALNKAFRDGHVDDDTAWRRVKPFEKVNAQRPGFLSLAECQRLIDAADADSGFRDLAHAALLTGARFGELRNVRVCEFVAGKLHIRTSKSGRARNIVLTEEGIAFFDRLAAGRAGNEYLLTRYGLPWRKSEQARPMREACERAKIVPPIGIHQARHTYASLSVMAGMPLQVLAANLGHTSTRMIEQHYAHLRNSYLDEAVRAHAPRFGLAQTTNVTAFEKSR